MPVHAPYEFDWDSRVLRLIEGDQALQRLIQLYRERFGLDEGKRRFLAALSLEYVRQSSRADSVSERGEAA